MPGMTRRGWIPDIPDGRDKTYSMVRPQGFLYKRISRKREVDLRENGVFPAPYDQGDLGSCVAQAWAAALSFLRAREGRPLTAYSRLALYYDIRLCYGQVDYDTGAQIRDGGKSLARTGLGKEELWPYDTSKWKEYPSMKCLHEGYHRRLGLEYFRLETQSDILDCLSQGWPVVFGATLYESFDLCAVAGYDGTVPMPARTEHVTGGHAMLMIGYSMPRKRYLVRNSWGHYWNPGMEGHCWIPFQYVEEFARDFWTIRKFAL